MYPSVISVTPRENYLLDILFDNGEKGVLDMAPFLKFGIFQQLQNPALFQQVRVSFDTIAWSGNLDLDPEFVYTHCQTGLISSTLVSLVGEMPYKE